MTQQGGSGRDATRLADLRFGQLPGPIARSIADDGSAARARPDLGTLLSELKATRQRRDEADFDSPEWRDADADLRDLQHEIFVTGMDDSAATRSAGRDPD